MEETWQPTARVVEPYFEHPLYIEALAQSVERAYADVAERPDILVVSYHGMPKRYLMQGDPYHCQCQKTTRLLRERLGWDETEITTTFQSVFGPEEWLRPYTVEEVARLAREDGKKRIAVMAPAFSADCIETLEEINEEIKESFEEAGGEQFTYIPCLNDDDAHIKALGRSSRTTSRAGSTDDPPRPDASSGLKRSRGVSGAGPRRPALPPSLRACVARTQNDNARRRRTAWKCFLRQRPLAVRSAKPACRLSRDRKAPGCARYRARCTRSRSAARSCACRACRGCGNRSS